MHHLVLGTAGHIDHGKSSLVKCLTGSDPDRLPEEKARGVTIELGFAHLSLKDGDTDYELGIVDVPGHADFVNNMVAGVGALDLAIFSIAADDGWMPQSEEHLHILTYLGVSNIVIALTKSDLCDDVPFSVELLKDELSNTGIAHAPIVPVSSTTGDGIDDLKAVLVEKLRACPPHACTDKPRLAIDRIFSPKGAGTVVTGTLTGGHINLGDTLTLQPQGISTKVRYIQNHSTALERAKPGMRTALNLPDLPVDAPGKPGARRGDTLTSALAGISTDTLDIKLTRLERPIPGIKPRPIKHMETVVMHHGSARCRARVILHGRHHLDPGESCLAQLRLEKKLFFLTADRLVLRDGSQQSTLAGGVVLDALATRQGFRSEARARFLNLRADKPDDPAIFLRTLLDRDILLEKSNPATNHPFHSDTIRETIEQMIAEGNVTTVGQHIVNSKWWKQRISQADRDIKAWHRKHPDLPAMPLDRLAQQVDVPVHIFQAFTQDLENEGFTTADNGIAHSSHTLTLPEQIKEVATDLLTRLDQAGLQPPNKSELTANAAADQAIKFLIRSGQVIELEPKVVISKQVRDQAIERVTQYLTIHGQATASELRQELGSTRKIVMPLLEHLDSLGITVRNENHRTLNQPR